MLIKVTTSAESDFITWLTAITIIGVLAFIILIAVSNIIKEREKSRLGRRTKVKNTTKPDYCYKTCSMIKLYQKVCQDHEKEKEALREQIKLQKQRIEYKERENIELRAELYKYKKQ